MRKPVMVSLVLLIMLLLCCSPGLPRAEFPKANSYTSTSNGLSTQTLILYNNTLVSGNPSVPGIITPVAMAFDSSNGRLYIFDSGSDSLFVVNPVTNIVTGTINLGQPITQGLTYGATESLLTYDPVNGYLYIANNFMGTVEIVNPRSNSVVANMSFPGFIPFSITPDTTNGNVYVLGIVNSSNFYLPTFYVLNGTTFETKIRVCGVSVTSQTAFDPSNGNLYFPCEELGKDLISVISTFSNQIVQNITLSSNSLSLELGVIYVPAVNLIYFYSRIIPASDQKFIAINPETGGIVANFSGSMPLQIFPGGQDPRTGKLYIPEAADPNGIFNLTVFDTASNSLISNMSLGISFIPSGEALDPSNDFLYVCSYGGWIYGVNLTSSELASTISLGSNLGAIAPDTSDGNVVISELVRGIYEYGYGYVMDGSTKSIASGPFNIGFETGMTYDPKSNDFYAWGPASNNITIMSASLPGVATSFNAGSAITAAASDPSTGLVYVGRNGYGMVLPSILVVNGSSPVNSIPVTSPITDIEYGNGLMYATDSSSVLVINQTGVLKTFSLNGTAEGVAYDPQGESLYITFSNPGNLSIMSAANGNISGKILIQNPSKPLYDPSDGLVYVADDSNGTIYAIMGSKIVTTIATGNPGAYLLAYNPKEQEVYAAIQFGSALMIITSASKLDLWPLLIPAIFGIIALAAIISAGYVTMRQRKRFPR